MRYIGLILFIIGISNLSEAANPQVSEIMLYEDDNGGTTTQTTQMTPNDEITLVTEISDGDGFEDIYSVNFYIWDGITTTKDGADNSSNHATYQWSKLLGWRLIGTLSSTWTIDKVNCTAATITPSTGILKLVFTPGKVSRQEEDKNWKISINIQSYTQSVPFDTIQAEIAVSNAYYNEIGIDKKEAFFNSNLAGTNDNPLPYSIHVNIISNATYTLQIKADNFIGENGTISESLGYALTNTPNLQTTITTPYQKIGTYSMTSEEGATQSLYFWLDYPEGLSTGTYTSQLYLQAAPGVEVSATLKAKIFESLQLQEIDNSIFPNLVTQGEKKGFHISIKNLSNIDVFLGTQSSLSLNGVTSTLIAETKVLEKGGADLDFNPVNIDLTPNTYLVSLSLKGTDINSYTYSQTLVGRNKVKVLPPYVTFIAENLPTEIKYPGQTNLEILRVKVENSYSSTKTITSIKLVGRGTQTISRVYLYHNFSLLGSATFTSDRVVFDNLLISIPPNYGTTTFFITYDLSLKEAKDGEIIDIQLEDVTFATNTTINTNFPLNSYGYHLIDGMISSQIVINHILPDNFKSGEINKPVLDIIIPSNGYTTDTLTSLNIKNTGNATENDLLLKLWVGDICLGTMSFTGDIWQITGLNQPIGTAGLEVFIKADIFDTASEGKTIKLRVPIGGIEVLSNNDGPIDNPIDNYYTQRIKVYNKVIFEALDLLKEKINPGDKELEILSLAVTNYYTEETKTLTSLIITNTNVGSGSINQLDSEMEMLYLYEGTTTIGISNYKNGKAIFSGLNLDISPAETKYLSVKYDVSLNNAKDNDIIDCQILAPTDISFTPGTTSVGGIFKLDSAGFHKIDGLVNTQIINYGAKATVVATGTTNVLVLDVFIPANGYTNDTLTKMRIKNSGTAKGLRDIKMVKLCVDENTYIAPWNTEQEYWEWGGTITITYPGKRILVLVDVADTPINGSTIMMKIPVDGLEFLSDNDGPRDSEVINPYLQTISTGLLSSLRLLSPKVVVGATITVIMAVKNTSTEDISTITPTRLILEGSGSANLISEPKSLPLLPAGSSTEFIWTYQASNYPGTLTFSGYATSSTLSSLNSSSELLYIQDIPEKLVVSHIPSMPFEVNKGQVDIMPMSIIFKNPATSTLTGDIVIDTLSFDVGTRPNQAIDKITFKRAGIVYGSKTKIETLGTTTILSLETPIVILPGQSIAVNLMLDIPTSTTTDRFQISLIGVNSNVAVEGNFPLDSGYTWIKTKSEGIVVGLQNDNVPRYVNKGQPDVLATQITFTNNNSSNSSKVEIIGLSMIISSTNTISKIRIKDETITYAEKDISSQNPIFIDLFTPIIIYNFKKIDIRVDIVDIPSTFDFNFGSLSVKARDYNTKENIPVELGTTTSSTIIIQSRAQEVILSASSTIPARVYQGEEGIQVFELAIYHAGTITNASILLKEVKLNIPQGITMIIEGGFGTGATPGTQNLTLITPATITPQTTMTLNFKIDILPQASLGETKLKLFDLKLVDANDFRIITATFSTIFALTQIVKQPSGLLVSYQNRIPVNLAKGEKNITLLALTFTNQGGTYTDEIKIGTISLSITDRFNNPISAKRVFSNLILSFDDTQIIKSNIPPDSKVTINLVPNLKVSVDEAKTVIIKGDISDLASAKNFKLGLETNSDIEATDNWGNAVGVSALPGYSFPMQSEEAIIFEPALDNSFTNYPNPFAAGRETTTIAYYLPQDGYVTIKIYTVIGDLVITLLQDSFKSQGMHQEDTWNGRNGVGEVVLNGVYFCQIKVNYLSGLSDKKVRKIAVVR